MLMARAQPMLGTVVSLQVHITQGQASLAERAMADALATMAHISDVMSAHRASSDVGRLSRAISGEVLTLDPETVRVLSAAKHWVAVSCGAFNPCRAAQSLSRDCRRPGLATEASGVLSDITWLSDTEVRLAKPVQLDFGGIAKGYAVDRAIERLKAHGIQDALVNAGGDLRVMGTHGWPIDVRHAQYTLIDGRTQARMRPYQTALATSVSGHLNPEFVASRPHRKLPWQSVTVQANTCMAADVLTKWAMQASLLCPDLKAVLRQHGGRMWRSR
jgi:thiamine biosynthesis lipoprotein